MADLMEMGVRKSLLILTSEPRTLIPAKSFLSNRDWTVFATTDVKEALTHLVEHKPTFMMISVEHPNRKVRGLPELLRQTYPQMCLIPFAENSTLESYGQLNQMDNPFKVYPPITGPAIERSVNRFMRRLKERLFQEELHQRALRRAQSAPSTFPVWAPLGEEQDSLLSKGTMRVFEELAEKGTGKIEQSLEGLTTNTACIAIDSPRFSGYLLAAMGGDRPFDESFLTLIRKRLVSYLEDNGEEVRDGDSFPMKIQQVRFESWASDYAEFLKKSVHQGHEVAFAFFPVSKVTPLIGDSADQEMVSVETTDLIVDQSLEFDLFLFLPANQKYLLYTPKGSVFYAHQKDRLLLQGVQQLYVRRADVLALKKSLAQFQINSLIEEYRQRRSDPTVS